MPLPLSRNRTYTSISPTNAADLNDLQDCVIGGKHGAVEFMYPASCAHSGRLPGTDDTGGWWLRYSGNSAAPGNVLYGSSWIKTGTLAEALIMPLPVPVGAILLNASVWYKRAGFDIPFSLRRSQSAVPDFSILASGNGSSVTPGAVLTLTPSTQPAVTRGQVFTLETSADAVDESEIFSFAVSYYMP